jgi:hypothetical protein
MVEALSADLSVESLMQYYDVCDFAFNFNLIVHLAEPLTAQDVDQQVHDWLDNLPDGKTANWVVRKRAKNGQTFDEKKRTNIQITYFLHITKKQPLG